MARRNKSGRIATVTPYWENNAPVGAERLSTKKKQTSDAMESPPELLC